MDRDTHLSPSSPTNSSPSSSDLDTQSTGSFFHDRSTTLGTLMGLTFPEIIARPSRGPSVRQPPPPVATAAAIGGHSVKVGRRRRRRVGNRWWRLCREDMGPSSLEEFLQAERELGNADGHFLYGNETPPLDEHEAVGGRLFENGRVLPPSRPSSLGDGRRHGSGGSAAGSIGRLPELIAGICSGGG
ncbi:hypothetical protein HPP92_008000 [Vanilla planifolia]|uniref:Uncharacterized protein n=1 Tax=Vanilla planifolia TaxID=51239 RepID=A0A835V6F1_VANPL|nr:hypothetical protein HPP92_008000 [Vanilla planifolia]